MNLPALLEGVAHWAAGEPEISAVALVGSQARGTAAAESDVDLVIIALSPEKYLSSDEWLGKFGQVLSVQEEDWGLVQSRRVSYRDGPEVEFGITAPRWVEADSVDQGTRQVVRDGLKILYDRDGLLRGLVEATSYGRTQS